MIISYKHEFIYWKPTKCGGSSILQALGEYCGPDDVVGQPGPLNDILDAGLQPQGRNMDGTGLSNHSSPDLILKQVSPEQWKSFFKFTIVRNPWDETISRFWYHRGRNKSQKKVERGSRVDFEKIKRDFDKWLKKKDSNTENKNLKYYFIDGEKVADYYMK